MTPATPLRERNPLRVAQAKTLRWCVYGALLLLAFFLQSAPRALTIGAAKPLLLLLLTVNIALFVGPVGGGVAGAGAGFLWDLFSARLPGFNGLILLIVGCACGFFARRRIRPLAAWLLAGAALLIQLLLDWGVHVWLSGKPDPVSALWWRYLPNGLYSLAVAPAVYFFIGAVARVLPRHDSAETYP